MKKIGLTVFAVISTLLVLAQAGSTPTTNRSDQKVRLGLSFSPVVSWFSTSGDEGAVTPDGIRANIAFGLHTDFQIANNSQYYFSTGLFLLNTGGTIRHDYFTELESGEFALTERTSDFRINYINIPLTIMLRTQEIGYMRYFGRVGFDTGISTKSTYDYTDVRQDIQNADELTKEDNDGSDLTGLFRFGLHVEAGLEWSIGGSTNLFFTAAYSHGLNNVFTDDYELPVMGDDGFVIDEISGEPTTEKEVKANTNLFTVTVGAYF